VGIIVRELNPAVELPPSSSHNGFGLAMDFTESQLNAVAHDSGNLQIIACAGSGKTEVVARRVATLLKNGGAEVRPGNIIAFTFTEKAAAELKQRIIARCREELRNWASLVCGIPRRACAL